MNKGRFGIHGGQFIPETLMNAVMDLEEAITDTGRIRISWRAGWLAAGVRRTAFLTATICREKMTRIWAGPRSILSRRI